MTQAVYQEDPQSGPTALHFALPIKGSALEPKDTWQVLGMRGTGSQHVVIQDVFVPDAAISLRRPAGQWTLIFHLFASYPLPLIYAVHLGIAEAMRDAVLRLADRRRHDADFAPVIGEIENELSAARLAHRDMVQAAEACEEPGVETTNRIMTGRTLVGRAVGRRWPKRPWKRSAAARSIGLPALSVCSATCRARASIGRSRRCNCGSAGAPRWASASTTKSVQAGRRTSRRESA